ncbi:TPA: glycosyltransferase family 4 protein [Raoultella ornithinolytica]
MIKINFDERWCGEHGIGRFAREIRNAIDMNELKLKGSPVSQFDIFRLTAKVLLTKGFFFTPGYTPPFFGLNKTLITVHDLNHIDIVANSSFTKKLYYNFILKRACRKCAKVLTVSAFSKQRIIEWANIRENQVVVVGNGVSDDFNTNVERFDPGFKYVFVVGNRKAHKNEDAGLKAFLLSSIPKEIKILFVGEKSAVLQNIIIEFNAENRVSFLGRLTDKELASVYAGAEMLLFPSLYEGFGLPVVEAMSCGTPVVTSSTSSLAEIAGGAACLINPESILSIQKGIEKVFFDESYRNELISKGLIQARCYTWNKTIDKVKEVLSDLSRKEG